MLRKMFAVMAVASVMVAGCGEAAKKAEAKKPEAGKMEPAAKDAKPAAPAEKK